MKANGAPDLVSNFWTPLPHYLLVSKGLEQSHFSGSVTTYSLSCRLRPVPLHTCYCSCISNNLWSPLQLSLHLHQCLLGPSLGGSLTLPHIKPQPLSTTPSILGLLPLQLKLHLHYWPLRASHGCSPWPLQSCSPYAAKTSTTWETDQCHLRDVPTWETLTYYQVQLPAWDVALAPSRPQCLFTESKEVLSRWLIQWCWSLLITVNFLAPANQHSLSE